MHMITLRPYQEKAVQSILSYWERGGGNPLVEMATGTGKSIVLAMLVKHLVEKYDIKILILTHVKELVAQNSSTMLKIWPSAPLGVNSASLGLRNKRNQILFASIQSIANEDIHTIGKRDVFLIDEAHLIPHIGDGRYRSLFKRFKSYNDDLKIAGFTATPYRLEGGLLYGKDCPFDDLIYSYGITEGIRDGFLCPIKSMAGKIEIDVRGIGKSNGDFILSSVEGRALDPNILNASCEDMVKRISKRRSCLVFCSGVQHAHQVKDYLLSLGESAECITGKVHQLQRDRIINEFKSNKFKYLTNANILTTGFDAPIIDSISMMRPTLSAGLYVQMLGRGTRPHDEKNFTLVLDYSGNIRRHGPVDAIENKSRNIDFKNKRAKEDDVNSKECPECNYLINKYAKTCPECNHLFERESSIISKYADIEMGVLKQEIEEKWIDVDKIYIKEHTSKAGNKCIKISYICGLSIYNEYLLFENTGYAKERAILWWEGMTGQKILYSNSELNIIKKCIECWKDVYLKNIKIKIKFENGFKRVTNRKFSRSGNTFCLPESLKISYMGKE